MIKRLPSEEHYEEVLHYFFKNIDERFTFGSDNEDTCDFLREGFDEFWCDFIYEGERPSHQQIVDLARELEDELYQREGLAEILDEPT